MNIIRIAVALVVVAIWAAAWIFSFADPAHSSPPLVLTPIALIAVGSILGREILGQLRDGGRDEDNY
jgi:hypothetical protein